MAVPLAKPNTSEPFLESADTLSITQKVRKWINSISDTVDRLNARVPTDNPALVEADANYQVLVGNEIINCDGALTISAIPIADTTLDSTYEITISATSGTCTYSADAAIESGGSVPSGSSVTFYRARGQWWRK